MMGALRLRAPARRRRGAARHRRLLALAAALALAAGACDVEVADEEPEAEEARVLPLTGLEAGGDEVLERSPVVVKVDNLAPARPQRGLEGADVVMVEPVEGATRLMAFFHSADPGIVGPVRSGRLLQAELLPPFDAVLVMSGAHGPVDQRLREALPAVFAEGQTPGWTRSAERRAPHNLYVEVAEVRDAAPGLPLPEQAWAFDADAPEGGDEAARFTVAYLAAGTSEWEWDVEAGRWLRGQDGQPHSTAEGDRLAADTVVVVVLPTTDRERLPVDPVGEGEATVFRDGRAYEARWRKSSAAAHMEIVTADGGPFALRPGVTWVELLPEDGALDRGDPPG